MQLFLPDFDEDVATTGFAVADFGLGVCSLFFFGIDDDDVDDDAVLLVFLTPIWVMSKNRSEAYNCN